MSAAIIFPVCIVFHHLSDLYSIKPVCHKWTFRFFPNPFYLKSNSATLLSLSSNFLPAFLSLQKKKKKKRATSLNSQRKQRPLHRDFVNFLPPHFYNVYF